MALLIETRRDLSIIPSSFHWRMHSCGLGRRWDGVAVLINGHFFGGQMCRGSMVAVGRAAHQVLFRTHLAVGDHVHSTLEIALLGRIGRPGQFLHFRKARRLSQTTLANKTRNTTTQQWTPTQQTKERTNEWTNHYLTRNRTHARTHPYSRNKPTNERMNEWTNHYFTRNHTHASWKYKNNRNKRTNEPIIIYSEQTNESSFYKARTHTHMNLPLGHATPQGP